MTNVTDYAPIKYGCNGASVDFVFPWKIFENEDVIVQIQDSEGNISTLNYGADYSVQFEAVGGNVKLKNIFEAGNSVIISRNVSDYQEKSFSTSPGFQASEIEKSLDRVSCNLQEMDYNIENFKETYSAQVGAQIEDLENVIEENKQEVLVIQERFEDSTNAKIDEFEDGIDAKVASVASAADKINTLDESIELCKESAEIATQQAQIAAEKVEEITNAKEEVLNVAQDITESNEQFKNEIEDELENMANLDLSNLTEVGEKHFLGKSQITNCITEIPQRIKLELKDGVLTLKAGSEVIVPNGFEADGTTPKFDYVTIESDSTIKNGANRQEIILSENGNITGGVPSAWTYSGATQPTVSTTFAIWYDTANNKIKLTINKGSTWLEGLSLPIALATSSTTQYTSIDQVFNGVGFIGSTMWVDKGVKALISDGRNEDGTLKNIEYITDRVRTVRQIASNTTGRHLFLTHEGEFGACFASNYLQGQDCEKPTITADAARVYYAYDTNVMYTSLANTTTWEKVNFVEITKFTCSTTAVLTLNPKTTFRAVDYNDKSEISGWAIPSGKYIDLKLGASGATYIAPANGYFWAGGNAGSVRLNANNMSISSNLLNGYWGGQTFIPVKNGDKVKVEYSNSETLVRFFYAKGEV
jgi:hypothetical protein